MSMLVFMGVLEINDRLFEISVVWLVLLAVAGDMLYGVPIQLIFVEVL